MERIESSNYIFIAQKTRRIDISIKNENWLFCHGRIIGVKHSILKI